MPYRLPLFPLGVVLFPGAPLPLHIFEPRYRTMLADCLAGDRRFGITPTGTTEERPVSGTVGCVAEIRVNQPLPDGRSNIVVLGGPRFHIVHAVPDSAPYHVAMVEDFGDDDGPPPDDETLARLRQLFADYHATLRELQDADPEDLTLDSDPAALTFQVAAALECAAAIKQRLLADRSAARRAGFLVELLPPLTGRVATALRVHRRAYTNGKGGSRPDIATG